MTSGRTGVLREKDYFAGGALPVNSSTTPHLSVHDSKGFDPIPEQCLTVGHLIIQKFLGLNFDRCIIYKLGPICRLCTDQKKSHMNVGSDGHMMHVLGRSREPVGFCSYWWHGAHCCNCF